MNYIFYFGMELYAVFNLNFVKSTLITHRHFSPPNVYQVSEQSFYPEKAKDSALGPRFIGL